MQQGETHEVFTRSAEIYDLIYRKILDYEVLSRRLVDVVESIAPHARSLLEVGCGTGLYLEQLSKHFEVAGLDLSQPMLDRAAARCPGVVLHRADMTHFDFGRGFDAVVCLFSSIGYVRTLDGLRRCIDDMARHTDPGGAVIVEPWFRPDTWDPTHIGADLFEYDDIKIARVSTSTVDSGCSVMDMHHMVATTEKVEVFTERHVMGLFTIDDHIDAFRRAGLEVEYEPEGLLGRGLYVGAKPG